MCHQIVQEIYGLFYESPTPVAQDVKSISCELLTGVTSTLNGHKSDWVPFSIRQHWKIEERRPVVGLPGRTTN